MLQIPILRQGRLYESVQKTTLVHHATRAPIAEVSQANSGMIVRDIHRMDDSALERFTVAELIELCRGAAKLFMTAELPLGVTESGQRQTFDAYIECLSATTGMPVAYCRTNAEKIHRVLDEIELVIAGLTRGCPLEILDTGYGADAGRMLSFFRAGRTFGAVLPSNSPGVHSLWAPAIALKTPIVLKPGREEPWTPLRMIAAMIAVGVPREAFSFYPTDHAGATALLEAVDRAMLFGDASTTKPWQGDPRVELHGPGYSKILLGDDWADDWRQHLDLMVDSIGGNAGRSCINASGVWTPRHGRAIAAALAELFAGVEALPAEDPNAQVAAFANPDVAERISAMIDGALRAPGAVDLTEEKRGGSRLVRRGDVAYLLPTIIWCESDEHPLANKEFLLPFAAVVEAPAEAMIDRIGPTLIGSALTADAAFSRRLMAAGHIDRLNIGAIPTNRISWDQPHEGNLFEHLYRQRAFQTEISV
jgi:acyl-CoA reductase-like NAD-dependent aldehyde dehydrogenase